MSHTASEQLVEPVAKSPHRCWWIVAGIVAAVGTGAFLTLAVVRWVPDRPAKELQAVDQRNATGSSEPPLMLSGYYPVCVRRHQKWKLGSRAIREVFDDVTYYLATEECRIEFLGNPAGFTVALQGQDVVKLRHAGIFVAGRREYGIVFDDRMFLFENAETRDVFENDPDAYARFAAEFSDAPSLLQ